VGPSHFQPLGHLGERPPLARLAHTALFLVLVTRITSSLFTMATRSVP
jgi:hypothetical protein